MNRIKIMIVDDSAFSRGVLGRLLAVEADMNVVATHSDGKAAVDDYMESAPDIILMDVDMPVMNGVDAAQAIMTMDPVARIIMCSSLDKNRVLDMLAATGLGTDNIDFLSKPAPSQGEGNLSIFGHELVNRVRMMHKRDYRSVAATVHSAPHTSEPRLLPMPPSLPPEFPKIMAIGGSTGGMGAVGQVLKDLKLPEHIPVMVTLHIPEEFSEILVRNIQKATNLPCHEATDGMPVRGGHVYVAPGGKHMIAKGGADNVFICLSDDPPRNLCRPSVDVMLESIADIYKDGILTVILTGMGTDGRGGCKYLLDKNAANIVVTQDEETSVVWGMPGAVAQAGYAHRVLPLERIAGFINRLTDKK